MFNITLSDVFLYKKSNKNVLHCYQFWGIPYVKCIYKIKNENYESIGLTLTTDNGRGDFRVEVLSRASRILDGTVNYENNVLALST